MIHRFHSADSVVPVSAIDNRTEEHIVNPLYQVDDKNSPDIAMALKMSREMINVNGAHTNIHARTDNYDIDKVFEEDPDPTYMAPDPFKGYFAPQPLAQELTLWGIDQENQTEIVYCREEIFKRFGKRLLRAGDLIEIPYNSLSNFQPKYYRIDTAQETGNYRYVWLYITCKVTLITGDPNIKPTSDTIRRDNNADI